jgi:surface polysaccharide O-acyltransferase-like enzyme
MLFIVAHHFGVHSAFEGEYSFFNDFIILIFSAYGKLAVNVFVLITGYFLVESKFKFKRVINVVALTIFYSVAIYSILAIYGKVDFSFGSFVRCFFPIYDNAYWFVTCFVALSLLSPFINKLLHALTQGQHILFIILLILMQGYIAFTSSYFHFSETAWFITLYVISGYIRRYPNKIFNSKLIMGICSTVFGLTVMLWEYAVSMRDLFCLCASISLFCLFKNLAIKSSRFINLIGKTTFGIYLIHDNRLLRPILWNRILLCPQHVHFDHFWIFAIACTLLVFVLCIIIELLRIGACKLIALGLNKIKR